MRRIGAIVAGVLLLGCNPALQLTAREIVAIVGTKVADGVFEKTVFDPVWEFFVGKPSEEELKSLKNGFVREAS